MNENIWVDTAFMTHFQGGDNCSPLANCESGRMQSAVVRWLDFSREGGNLGVFYDHLNFKMKADWNNFKSLRTMCNVCRHTWSKKDILTLILMRVKKQGWAKLADLKVQLHYWAPVWPWASSLHPDYMCNMEMIVVPASQGEMKFEVRSI